MEIKINSDDLLTVPKAAKQLGRPKMTLYRWIKVSKIIYVELGGVLFIPKSEIERLKNEKAALKAQLEERAHA